MSSTFFITDLPANIGEATLRTLWHGDIAVAVSFRNSPAGTVGMVEARNAQEAQSAADELARYTLEAGAPLTVIATDTPEGENCGRSLVSERIGDNVCVKCAEHIRHALSL